MPDSKKNIGLVLPAGGARAAYQVGVLRYCATAFPEFRPRIFTGVSAGSINACFLAQGDPFPAATKELYELWTKLQFDQVLRTNFQSVFSMTSRWMYDMFISKITRKLLLKSLLDASPLAHTLLSHIHFWKVTRALRHGLIDGLSVSCTNYHDGSTAIFYDSKEDIKPWIREQRKAIRTAIRMRHIMASCSIPILFEPIRIGDFLYGDGSLRYNFPFGPAIHLGATHLFAVGIRCPKPENVLGVKPDHVSIGFVAGAVMNSIFLDSIDADYENVCRLNFAADGINVKRTPATLIRPSRDLGAMAKDHFEEVPFHFRQVLRSLANPEELGDLLSYLMFSPQYINTLLELGKKDGEANHDLIANWLKS